MIGSRTTTTHHGLRTLIRMSRQRLPGKFPSKNSWPDRTLPYASEHAHDLLGVGCSDLADDV